MYKKKKTLLSLMQVRRYFLGSGCDNLMFFMADALIIMYSVTPNDADWLIDQLLGAKVKNSKISLRFLQT